MGRIGMPELIVIGLIVLILFGAKNLPEIGRSLGRAIKEFQKAGRDLNDDVQTAHQPPAEKDQPT